ncbi:conserved exported hypothetical protein [metagenome]|uniref:Gram-positive cocci surface proteins LPxTG domain-containing protein n=1 Tax=metagenome TaxID=256318 RepID=A0A2P2BY63_9ZZZZ
MIRHARSLGIAVVLVGALAVPASAAGDQIGLSRDGVTWSDHLAAPLFDPAVRWVPGDTRVESFLVRNQSTTGGLLDLELHDGTVDDLLQTGDLSVATKVGDADWTTVSGEGVALGGAISVAPGEHERVSVRVSFDEASTNQSQALALDLDLTARLTQDDQTSTPGGPLPATGGPSGWVALTGAVLLAAGWLLVGSRRRKEQPDA